VKQEACLFCKILKGGIPSYKILEDKDFYSFLTINPINPGHSLVIPKNHSEYIFEMGEALQGKILEFSGKVARALEKSMNPKTGKIGIMVAGLEVPHTHIHLIPMDGEGDLNFAKAKPVSQKELKDSQKKITSVLE
jgi:histidine triad (HIT) family protein